MEPLPLTPPRPGREDKIPLLAAFLTEYQKRIQEVEVTCSPSPVGEGVRGRGRGRGSIKLQFIKCFCIHSIDYLYFCSAKMSQRVRLSKKSLIRIIINNKMDDYHAETND